LIEVTPPDDTLLSPAAVRVIRQRVRTWGRENYKPFPWRKPTRLWHALIAEVLLQRTRARNVVPVYEKFIARFPEAEDLKTATLEEIETLIYPLGLRWRAPLLKQLCDYLNATNGQVPCTYEKLLGLTAVGPYVAAAILSFHCGKRGVLIDANVVRWLCRLVDRPMDGETRRKKWLIELAQAVTPRQQVHEFNYAVLDFTMEICAKVPKCTQCPVGPKLCLHGRKVLSVQENQSASVSPSSVA
jgi:A/G-specific adenine glycosylase